MVTNYVKPSAGEQILVQVSSDGGITFTHPALINTTRGFTQTLSTTTDELMDMNNPTNPAQTVRSAKATDTKIDGAGIMDVDSYLAYANWAASGAARPTKLFVNCANTGATANTITATGNYFLTQLQLTGTSHQKATVSLTLEQANAVTITST